MNDLQIIDQHIIIRETVGYALLDEIDVVDMPEFLRFLKIVYNYKNMLGVYENNI
jgi:hypothetical protein